MTIKYLLFLLMLREKIFLNRNCEYQMNELYIKNTNCTKEEFLKKKIIIKRHVK